MRIRKECPVTFALALLASLALGLSACSSQPASRAGETSVFSHGLNAFEGIVDISSVQIDPGTFVEGDGAARIQVSSTTTVKLFEIPDPDLEAIRLIYRAKLKAENVAGKGYLEMWCRFPGKGEFFSRSLQAPVTGTTGWTEVETPFFLKKGENPDYVRLNLVIEGSGTVWVDDVRLVTVPL